MEEDIPKNSSAEVENAQNFLEMELEALQSIYVNEVEVIYNEQSTSVSIDLHPATADKLDEQYVKMTLAFTLDNEYPHHIPEVQIRNPRGLSDEKLPSIIQDLKSIAENRIGNSMLFEMIEAAKEQLTVVNRPCGECAICLYSFSDDDVFTKTNCYHYFHSHCLARYSKTAVAEEVEKDDPSPGEDNVADKELVCPVCRLPIHFEGSEEDFPPPSLREEEIVISENVLETQKKMADLYQKQVDKGGIIDVEAEKNKYLLEISTVPTRTSEEAAPSDKTEENEGAQSHSPQKEVDKNTNTDPNSSRRDGKAKNYKGQNKQSRNNYNQDRTNKRYDNARPKYDKDRAQNSEELCDDPKSSGSRSEANSYRKNERWNSYGPQRRYEDDYSRGNYHRYPDTRGGNRGRRFPSNGYERRNFRGGYRGRGGRSNSERENPREQDHKVEDEVPTLDSEEAKELSEKNCPDEGERNNSGRNRQNPRKKHSENERDPKGKSDSYQDQQEYAPDEVTEKDDHHRNYPDKFRQGSYQDRRQQYSDIRYSDRDSQPQRRGGYGGRYNSEKGSYGRGRNNRGSFRNSFRRENSEEEAQVKDETPRDEEESEDKGNRYHKRQFNDQSYRGGRGNPRRNGNSYRQNFDEKRVDYRNGTEDYSKDNEDLNLERSSDAAHDKGPKSDLAEESGSNRYANRNSHDHPQRYEDRRDYNPQRGYRDSERHRQNSDAYEDRRGYNSQRGYRDYDRNRQNSDNYRRNQRYSNDRPYRNKNDSYQYKNSSSRKYNNDQYPDASNSTARQVERENSEIPVGETSSEKTAADVPNPTKIPASVDKGLSSTESSQNKPQSNETPCKDVPPNPPASLPAAKPNANFSNSPKMQQPPPGFSNPLKKVVYGLKAANPPPGFPRS